MRTGFTFEVTVGSAGVSHVSTVLFISNVLSWCTERSMCMPSGDDGVANRKGDKARSISLQTGGRRIPAVPGIPS